MNKRAFYQNTALMTACSLILRLMGILFRIFVSNRVGAEGMGLYQLAFSVYVLGSTFATGGLITAITRLAAERFVRQDREGVNRLMRMGAVISLLVGGGSALILYAGAPLIGDWVGDPRTVSAIAVSGIALPFIGVSGCIKGYFMARRKALPPCLSQIFEQTVRIGGISSALALLWDGSLEQACLIIILGDGLAEAVSCLYLLWAYRRDSRALSTPTSGTAGGPVPLLKPLLNIALPLTAGRYVSTALRTVENILVPARLTRYTCSNALALAQFGAVKGMALPLIFFPSALLMTVSGLLIPELSDAHALGQRRQVARLVESSLQITLLGAVLVGGWFTLLGRSLGELLYRDPLTGMLLQVLGPLTPVMYLDSVATGMLKGLGQQVHSLWFGMADSAVRIGLIWFLLPRYGLTGFLLVMVVSNLLTAVLSTARLLTVSGAAIKWRRWLLRPLLAAGVAGGLTALIPAGGVLLTVAGAAAFTAVYGGLLALLRCFTKEDWLRLTTRKVQQKTAVG